MAIPSPAGLEFRYLHRTSGAGELEIVRALMREYAAMSHVVGRWHDPESDIAALPAPFDSPHGALVVAFLDETPVGCGAVAAFTADIAEMKRVYVRPAVRGRGIGEQLCRELIRYATAQGYARLHLDTAPELHAARALYGRLGFLPIPPYRDGLGADALCYSKPLCTDDT